VTTELEPAPQPVHSRTGRFKATLQIALVANGSWLNRFQDRCKAMLPLLLKLLAPGLLQ